MGMLVFLAVNFLASLPFRYVGDGRIYGYVPPRLAFMGLALLLPGMVLAAVLGARTYRVGRRRGTRVGAGVGALIGWTGFFSLAWIANALGFSSRDQAFQVVVFPGLRDSAAYYVFPQLAVLAALIVMFSLYSREAGMELRQRTALAGTALALIAGFLVIFTSFDELGVAGVLISTFSGAIAGYVSGAGYARAGGEEMIPPGATPR